MPELETKSDPSTKLTKNQKEYQTKLSMQIRDMTDRQMSANALKIYSIDQLLEIQNTLLHKEKIKLNELGGIVLEKK